ncbi:hypothetical protein [Knoellia sp. LjRoot47]|uniref:hypothetical protein n=1 Tax=Knoellia sp. LjRoot47 TaxID=3342330 RepID=UPI003ECDCC8C
MRDDDRRPIHWHDDKTPDDPTSEPLDDEAGRPTQSGHSRSHALMMLACCVPMLFIVFALVGTGVLGAGAITYALLCVVMMAVMMLLMTGPRE